MKIIVNNGETTGPKARQSQAAGVTTREMRNDAGIVRREVGYRDAPHLK